MNKVFVGNALDQLKKIHALSCKVNGLSEQGHQNKLLQLVRSHVDEIEMLYAKKDPHAIVETGDLLILCLELLIENQADCNAVIHKCFERYEKKLTQLLERK
ncbi:hypothetical protein ACFL49_02540 [Candidatus Omnitrophota bacterium]